MSAHVLFNLLNKLKKTDQKRGLPFINSITQKHECYILLIT